MYAKVLKANPYHDERGRFTSESSAKVVSGVGSLFHGTSDDSAQKIVAQGFKASKGGMYGDGVYLTNDKSKADFFGDRTVKVALPKGFKFKTFTEKEYEDFYWDAIEPTQGQRRADAFTQALSSKGFKGHAVKRSNGDTYFVVHDPTAFSKVSVQKAEGLTFYMRKVPKKTKKAATAYHKPTLVS